MPSPFSRRHGLLSILYTAQAEISCQLTIRTTPENSPRYPYFSHRVPQYAASYTNRSLWTGLYTLACCVF